MFPQTTSFGESKPRIICDEMLAEVVEKVLYEAAQHVHVVDLAQIGQLMPLDELLLELLDLRVGTIDAV